MGVSLVADNRDGEPNLDSSEAAYLRFVAALARGAVANLEEYCRVEPQHATGLRRVHQHLSSENQSDSVFTRGLAERLLDKYETELGVEPEPYQATDVPSRFDYEIRGEVARGGMGVIREVWDPVLRRSLAMKQVRDDAGEAGSPGGISPGFSRRLDRFLREARITAQLDHPGVVPVHELRVDPDGSPFFTMRLVQGRDLRTILELARLGEEGWNLTRAIEVLIKVGDTLAYAHSHRVIHRDLKPANVMVGAFGEVYVMDWGLAKVLTDEEPESTEPRRDHGHEIADVTLAGSVLGTPSFMAPEQAFGDLDRVGPAADVYALGAMLYLLLTGRSPYSGETQSPASGKILEALRTGPPSRVLQIAPDASPELAAICEGAMTWDLESRTNRASDVADGLRGYLAAEQEAREEARRAKDEAQRAGAVSSFLTELFVTSDPAMHQGKELTAREILDRGAERLESGLEDQPIVRADLMATIGTIYLQLGLFDRAKQFHEESLKARESMLDSKEAIENISALVAIDQSQGNFTDAEVRATQALELSRSVYEPTDQAIGQALNNLAVCQMNMGQLDQAEECLREAVNYLSPTDDAAPESKAEEGREMPRRVPYSADPEDMTGQIYNNLGSLCQRTGQDEEAEEWLRRALEYNLKTLGPSHPEIAINLNNLAGGLRILGRFEEAERFYRESLELRRKVFGPKHPKVAMSLGSYSVLLTRLDRLEEAEEMLREALEINLCSQGEHHPSVAANYQNRAENLMRMGELDKAEELALHAVKMRRVFIEEPNRETADALQTLGLVLGKAGKLEEAARILDEFEQTLRELNLLEHRGFQRGSLARARVSLDSFELTDALERARSILARVDQSHPGWTEIRRFYAVTMAANGLIDEAGALACDLDDAEPLLEELERFESLASRAEKQHVAERLRTARKTVSDRSRG